MVFSRDVLRYPYMYCNMAQTHALVLHNPLSISRDLDQPRYGTVVRVRSRASLLPACLPVYIVTGNPVRGGGGGGGRGKHGGDSETLLDLPGSLRHLETPFPWQQWTDGPPHGMFLIPPQPSSS